MRHHVEPGGKALFEPELYSPPLTKEFVRVELMVLDTGLAANGTTNPGSNQEANLCDALMCGFRRLLRPQPGVSIRFECDRVEIVVGDEEVDLGLEVYRWFVRSLRSGKADAEFFEISLPRNWLRPIVAEQAYSREPLPI